MDTKNTNIETVKELLIARMPPYPVKRSNLVDRYGQGVVRALNELMAENKVLRAKRGYYSLSDELLDTRGDESGYSLEDETEDSREFMPTETLVLIISSWVSQGTLTTLLEKESEDLLKELDYYTTTTTGDVDGDYETNKEELLSHLTCYKHTDEGISLLRLLTAGK